MPQTPMKRGTRIETIGCPAMGNFPAVTPERATILRPYDKADARLAGYYLVRFESDGGRLGMHESSFRVIGNRP